MTQMQEMTLEELVRSREFLTPQEVAGPLRCSAKKVQNMITARKIPSSVVREFGSRYLLKSKPFWDWFEGQAFEAARSASR